MIACPAGIENARATPKTTITREHRPGDREAGEREREQRERAEELERDAQRRGSARGCAGPRCAPPAAPAARTAGTATGRSGRGRADRRVIAYTCQPTATVCICTATEASSRADRKRVKPGYWSSRLSGAPLDSRKDMRRRSAPDEQSQHAPERLGRAPQELVADRERGDVVLAHREVTDAADRDVERAGDRGGRERARARPRARSARCAPSRARPRSHARRRRSSSRASA